MALSAHRFYRWRDARDAMLIPLFGAVAGAIVGSYLATIIARWPRMQSASTGRSRCDACGAPVPYHAMVPLISYAAMRGRCRACRAPIDAIHPLIELAAAAIAVIALIVADWPQALAGMAFGWALLVLFALDVRHFWLPDRITLPLILVGITVALAGLGPPPRDSVIGAAAGFGSLWLIGEAYRRLRDRTGLGGGDPKLLAAIGAWCGWMALPVILLAAALAGLAFVLLRFATGNPVGADTRVAFGALMAVAAWPAWLLMIAR